MLKDAQRIVEILQKMGFKAYLVGGCVRDLLMNRPLNDVDITTSARPEEVMEIFPKEDFYTVPTGVEHGTVTVVLNGVNFEVTTFRKDVSTDGRGCQVEFGNSLEEDLLRRDFTMNAVAYCPTEDVYIDPFGGREDIKDRIIRSVGVPIDRFREDYLRMIRAHRFEATLEFILDKPTGEALVCAASEAWSKIVSVERIREEINKCFKQAERPSIMLDGMRKSNILQQVLPELVLCFGFEQNKHHPYDLYRHTLRTVDAVPKERHLIRWAALFHDLGKVVTCENYGPDATFYAHEKVSKVAASKVMKRFKFSKDDTDYVLNLVRHHMFQYSDNMKDSSVRRLISSVGEEHVEDLCILRYADKVGKGREPVPEFGTESAGLLKRLDRMAKEERLFKIKDLAIGGREVIEIKKIPPSSRVGDILRALFEIVVEDPSKNTSDQLRRIVEDL